MRIFPHKRLSGETFLDSVSHILVIRYLIEIEVLVDIGAALVEHAHICQIFFLGRNATEFRANGGQLGGAQIHVGVFAQTIGKVTRTG